MKDVMKIMGALLIFKTNVRLKKDLRSVAAVLNNIPEIERWNLDWQDIDRVLRVETRFLTAIDVIIILKDMGYTCEELPD